MNAIFAMQPWQRAELVTALITHANAVMDMAKLETCLSHSYVQIAMTIELSTTTWATTPT
ncbi:hypothetical protein [Acinetobacter sp. WU_MDCI_Abxc22]|uniref:hypothetical protein n=1 Tax=Acinetobacter sp. WU_MDCI_Abxc22 TaxID=2850071 RepID=UPI0021CDE561|nr:hypothetical protein [Acinetobacter sp. WU_MDCI_Abxc22]MCU4362650.1 hypothetical protein [Acinetobacter sp. WU_MDCI_Abxc22]